MDKKNYYTIMGLQKDASPQEIKMAYRRLARKYHPDLNKESDAEQKFKELGEAYEVLKDPKKRQMYDQVQSQPQYERDNSSDHTYTRSSWDGAQNANGFDADLFESLFGAARARGPRNGADLQGTMVISLQEAFTGVVKDIVLPTPQGEQKLRVKIPAGIKSGQQIRLAGQGEQGMQGGPSGDFFITINVKRDSFFDVVENDIYMTLPITPWEAALGATVKVPTLAGLVDLKIPSHSQGGQKLRLKKRGLPGKTPGDQYVMLKIVIPQPRTDDAIHLYEAMAKEMPFNPREKMEGYHE